MLGLWFFPFSLARTNEEFFRADAADFFFFLPFLFPPASRQGVDRGNGRSASK